MSTSAFTGFVLLSDAKLDIDKFLKDLKEDWNITLNLGKENKEKDNLKEKLEKECEIALRQIDEKKYSSVLRNAGIEKVLKIGIAFLGKEFEVKFDRD